MWGQIGEGNFERGLRCEVSPLPLCVRTDCGPDEAKVLSREIAVIGWTKADGQFAECMRFFGNLQSGINDAEDHRICRLQRDAAHGKNR